MFDATPRTLKTLAALVWYGGAVILFFKSASLFVEAQRINPDKNWIWLAVFIGSLLGIIKARYLFSRVCFKNLRRIDALEYPKIWHFYRARFFVFLITMVSLGVFFSQQAHGNYQLLIIVAFVDISIATALLGSSYCFWKDK